MTRKPDTTEAGAISLERIKELSEALRSYAERDTGYIYADEVAVLREASDALIEGASEVKAKLVQEHRRRLEAEAEVDGLTRSGGEWLIERLREMAEALLQGNDAMLREGLDLYREIEDTSGLFRSGEAQMEFDRWAYRAFGPDGPIRAALTPYDEKVLPSGEKKPQ